jgi:peptidase C25-like protein/interleukin-like EMT inducer protein/flagellar hook capping protein FlgD/CARDB protein
MRSLFIVLALCVVANSSMVAQNGTPFSVMHTGDGRWNISIDNSAPFIVPMDIDSIYSVVQIPGYLRHAEQGTPALPFKRFWFPASAQSQFTVTTLSIQEGQLSERLTVLPVLAHIPAATSTVFLSSNAYFRDGGLHEVGGKLQQAIDLIAADYDAETGELRWLRDGVFEVRATTSNDFSKQLDFFEPDDIEGKLAAYNTQTKSFTSWFDAGEQMLQIRILNEGIYRLSYEELVNTVAALDTEDPRNFQLYLNGEELPVIVRGESDGSFDSGDYIEFFSPRKPGLNGEYYDDWVDDNVLWLRWGMAPGRRVGSVSGDPTAGTAISSVPAVLHLEEDHAYHLGDNDIIDANQSERAYGENWVWKYINKDSTFTMRFDLASVLNQEATLVSKFKMASLDESRLHLLVNGTFVKEFDINRDQVGALLYVFDTTSIPAGLLIEGENSISFHSIGKKLCPPDTICSIERVYFDWSDLYYQRGLTANEGAISIDHEAYAFQSSPAPRLSMKLSGFPEGKLTVFNQSTGDTLSAVVQSPDGNGQNLEFSYSSDQDLIAYSDAAIQTVLSLKAVTMTDYSLESNGADYLIVTHKNFMPAAQRLANYRRSSDGYRVVIADIDDLYNEFNHGHKNPAAIKRFVMNAYGTWSKPAARFLTIIGDASWDAKMSMNGSFKVDYVPTFGNPVADTYFVSVDTLDVYCLLANGRIPSESNAEADAVIDKIIEYEAGEPADWHNRLMFTAGGKSAWELGVFQNQAEAQISRFVDPNCLEPVRIYKQNYELVSFEDLDSIITKVNDGVLWFNFIGHGGTRIIDIGIERPDIFNVQGKYPVFATMSCNTAHFGEPYETGLNEKFILAPNNGAIISLGTAGLGLVSIDDLLSNKMFESFISGTAKTFGEVVSAGKEGLRTVYDISSNFLARNTVNQYALLGDPATRIPLSQIPELAVTPEDISSDSEILLEGTDSHVLTEIHNHGFCLQDSVRVNILISSTERELYTDSKLIPPFGESITLEWDILITDHTGSVSIAVTVDPDNTIIEKTKTNNTATTQWNVLPRGVTPIFPRNYSVINIRDSYDFVVANPSIVPLEKDDVQIEVEIATDANFTQIALRKSEDIGQVFTWFNDVTLSNGDGIHYWRARLVADAVPESWSPTWSFRHAIQGGGEYWHQQTMQQMNSANVLNVDVSPDGEVTLGKRDIVVEILSAGNNNVEVFNLAQLKFDGNDVSPNIRGFNVAVIEPLKGSVVDTAFFDTYGGRHPEAARMAAYLRAVPDENYVAIAIRDDANGNPPTSVGGTNITDDLRNAIREFGSLRIDSVGFRDSYAMFGRRSEPARIKDAYSVFGAVFFRDTIVAQATEGIIRSAQIGPANEWNKFTWQGDLPSPDSRISLTVHAGASERDTILFQQDNIQPGNPVSLNSIGNAAPFIVLEVSFYDPSGTASPVLKSWECSYSSAFPELGITNQVVEAEPDSVLEGNPISLTVQVYNAGRADAINVPVTVSTPRMNGGSHTIIIPEIEAAKDSYSEFQYDIPTVGLNGAWNAGISIDPEMQNSEYYRGNNNFARSFISSKDNVRPDLEVLFDGVPILDLDYVSPTPVIDIRLLDDSPLPVTDTSSIQIFLDGRRVWLTTNPDIQYSLGGSGEDKYSIVFTPELNPGIRMLSVTGKDADGNTADSIPYQVTFRVSSDDLIDQVFPVPNPSAGPMNFSFRVLGKSPPESGTVKIYTLAGRLIREIEVPDGSVRIGFNRIGWDGNDQDGDRLANGVYLYKLILTREGRNEEFLGKIAVLR